MATATVSPQESIRSQPVGLATPMRAAAVALAEWQLRSHES